MFRHILEVAIWIINAVSIMVLLWGVLLTVKNFVISEIKSKDRIEAVKKITIVKNCLGTYILLGLEILICADIIESILNPTFHDIIVLASIVVIRTVISYFLNKEIESNKEHLEN
ncbi:TPA: DUF1622 domain-containing protein [Clostridium perfringens]|uniref:DUF1622 domain-containing protein n=1 Tax=Clostridium perfringens TaxID=1502 RepID=UPI001009BB2C|nr:DUF1622 domain-containing protein [Clostridium perfringens]MDG6877129.1 hypothetical protein [Clostridium perfringens]MDG6886943.1 hypothetical protein [Clostridium perfringens]MDH5078249.1 hypothetical protein [Clostridium perfringens]MDK0721508.1 DUF1622 domain-containing protein [Clostridium perfringens]MDK0768888.1 DUF1622 domain-containing protein [Clostridium perfringens]